MLFLIMSSDEAKLATKNEIQGIIDFLNECLQNTDVDLRRDQTYLKYHLPFAQTMVNAEISREMQLRAEIQYYTSLLASYIEQGRA